MDTFSYFLVILGLAAAIAIVVGCFYMRKCERKAKADIRGYVKSIKQRKQAELPKLQPLTFSQRMNYPFGYDKNQNWQNN